VLIGSRLGPAIAAAIALVVIGCGERSGRPPTLDGVYRASISAKDLAAIDAPNEIARTWGAWTLVLNGGRFALTQDGDQGCAWFYGALGLGNHNLMNWTIIDSGAVPAVAASNQRGDRYQLRWTRYRDLLTLTAVRRGSAGYFAARPWRRIARTPTATALSTHCPPPPGALEPTGAEHARPSRDAAIHFTADLVKTTPTTWKGSGTEEALGRGNLTIEGEISFSRDPTRRRLTFTARFPKGELRGCMITRILRRPHARYLWSGDGQITGASATLHAVLGLEVRLHGTTMADAPTHMHGGLTAGSPPQRTSTAPPGDLC
jgi:hypothetical protein